MLQQTSSSPPGDMTSLVALTLPREYFGASTCMMQQKNIYIIAEDSHI